MAYGALFVLILAFLSHSLAAPAGHLPFKLSNTASRSTPEHYENTHPPSSQTSSTTSIISTTATISDTTIPHDPNTKFCRQVHAPPSKCVDPPSFTHHGVDFCPYRMCTPKYVEAALCPANPHLGAKAKCYEEEITRDVYKCDHLYEKTRTVPPGCTIGDGVCKEVPFCSCFKIPDVTTSQLKFITIFKPYCGAVTYAKEE